MPRVRNSRPKRKFARPGYFRADDGTEQPLDGRDRTVALRQWRRDNGRPVGTRASAGGTVSADFEASGGSDESSGGGVVDGDPGDDRERADRGTGDEDGRPRVVRLRTAGKRKRKTAGEKGLASSLDLETDEEVAKYVRLIQGAFLFADALRGQTGVWPISEQDALLIAEPFNECLKKFPKVAEKILDTSPPIMLGIALASTIGPRVVADKMYHDMLAAQARNAARNVTPPPQHPYTGPQTVPPMPPQGAPPQGPSMSSDGPPFPKDLGGIPGWQEASV